MTGIAALALFAVVAAHVDAGPERHRFRELAMGCEVRIEIAAADAESAARAARAGFDRIKQLDEALSDYLPTGAVSRLKLVPGIPEAVGDDLSGALAISLRVAHATGGAFDATCGAISSCWRAARATGVLPKTAALDAARECSGFAHIRLLTAPSRIAVDCEGLSLDFGAVGKGLAASEAIRAISAAGIESALVAVAGDIAASAGPPRTPGWLVRIETGVKGDGGTTVLLVDSCISTCGDESQSITVDGVRYSHVFDPRTGRALTRGVAATVVAKSGAVADALSTALRVDPERLLAKRSEIAAALGDFQARVVEANEGSTTARVETTPGFAALTRVSPAPGSPPVPAATDPTRGPAASGSAGR